jgi:hypothetical protein
MAKAVTPARTDYGPDFPDEAHGLLAAWRARVLRLAELAAAELAADGDLALRGPFRYDMRRWFVEEGYLATSQGGVLGAHAVDQGYPPLRKIVSIARARTARRYAGTPADRARFGRQIDRLDNLMIELYRPAPRFWEAIEYTEEGRARFASSWVSAPPSVRDQVVERLSRTYQPVWAVRARRRHEADAFRGGAIATVTLTAAVMAVAGLIAAASWLLKRVG